MYFEDFEEGDNKVKTALTYEWSPNDRTESIPLSYYLLLSCLPDY